MRGLIVADAEQPQRALVAGVGFQRVFQKRARFALDAVIGLLERERLGVFDREVGIVRRLFVRVLERVQRLVGSARGLIRAAEQCPAFHVFRMILEARDERRDRLFHLGATVAVGSSGFGLEVCRIERLRCADQSIQQQRRRRQQDRNQQQRGECGARRTIRVGLCNDGRIRDGGTLRGELIGGDDAGGERFVERAQASCRRVRCGSCVRSTAQRQDDERKRSGDHRGRQHHE